MNRPSGRHPLGSPRKDEDSSLDQPQNGPVGVRIKEEEESGEQTEEEQEEEDGGGGGWLL